MQEIKLKPCPFCGGIPKLEHKDEMWDSQIYRATYIQCEVCRAKTKEVWNTHYNDKPNEREKEVIEAWNRRT